MSTINDGGPAFPGFGEVHTTDAQGRCGPQSLWGLQGSSGMSLRDWFAGQALAGIVFYQAARLREDPSKPDETRVTQLTAIEAYAIADGMLAERAKCEGGAD